MQPREFILGSPEADPRAVLDAAGCGYALHDAGARTVERTWLDTFDWRLHAAGLTLAQITNPDETFLELTAADDHERLHQPSAASWPSLLDRLPEGPVRTRLSSVVEARALLPVALTRDSVREVRVLNSDAKTVLRLFLERSRQTDPVERPLPPRISLVPVRGYPKPATKIARALASTDGVDHVATSPLVALLDGTGRTPGDYTGKVTVALHRDQPASAAVAAVLLHLLDTLERNVEGTLDDVDTEFLHDLRVTVRRTRSALKLAGDALPGGLAARYAPAFKWLGDLTTPSRDLDVHLLELDELTRELVAAAPADLEPFGRHLRRRRTAERRRLVRGLRSVRFATLVRDWRTALEEVGDTSTGTIGELAADRIRRAHRRVLKRGSAITEASPAEALHDLRKRGKELRYLLEFFASLHDPAAHRRLVKDLKGLQDCLGEFQDSEVQGEAIRAFAAEMTAAGTASADTLLAMGELTAHLDARQRRARREFAERFATFGRPANTRRMASLQAGVPA